MKKCQNMCIKKFIPTLSLLLTMFIFSPSLLADNTPIDFQAELLPAPKSDNRGYFQPPGWESMPDGEFGLAVKRGYNIFVNTQHYASDYVGNGLNCSNCHLNSGRRENSAPLWAAWVSYPKYRKKNDKINTIEKRIQGCFTYSLNATGSMAGHAPESGSAILSDVQTYMYWLATGAPTGTEMAGRGYPKLNKSKRSPDPVRGKNVYIDQCSICHGENGGGMKVNNKYAFPPLWGANSYNWGAGMHRVNTAAGFIKANMPLSKPYSLTDQQAWDVAAYINSQERPVDPRDKGDIQTTAKKFHKHQGYYGKKINGHPLGQGSNNTR